MSGCEQNQPKTERQIVGPAGSDVTSRPRQTPAPGSVVLEGCCSIEAEDAEVEELFGDQQGRRIKSEGYELIVSYGASLDQRPKMEGWQQKVVDGVKVSFRNLDPSQSEMSSLLFAEIPAKGGPGVTITNPQLRITGRCLSVVACNQADQVITSLRF